MLEVLSGKVGTVIEAQKSPVQFFIGRMHIGLACLPIQRTIG